MDEREEEKLFLNSLQQFWETKGVANIKIPQIGGRELEVYRLYKAVTKRGGSQIVSNNKQWKEIVNEFGLPPTCTSASFTLRNHYQRLLLSYEQKFFFGKDDGSVYVDPDILQIRKKIKPSFEEEDRSQQQLQQQQQQIQQQKQIKLNKITINQSPTQIKKRIELPEQQFYQHEYTENQLSSILNAYYSKFDRNDPIYFIKKTKIFPTQSEMKRIVLAFDSRLDEEITFAINNLLLYSCNTQQSFLIEQTPQLLENIVNYIEDSLKNIPSLQGVQKIKSIPITISSNQLNSAGFEHSENIYLEQSLFETANIIDNYNLPVSQIINNNNNSTKIRPRELIRQRNLLNLIQGTYEKKSESKLLEKLRTIFTILRNLCMIRANEQALIKNEPLKCILLQLFILNIDSELSRSSQDILSMLSKHIHLKKIPYMDEFLKRIFEGLNSESSEETDLSVDILRNLIAVQENEQTLEIYLNDYLESLAKLLIYQNQDVRESVLEFFCYLSDLKMSTRLQIAKHPFIIMRIVALLLSGPSKTNDRNSFDKLNEKNIKLAAITLNNISQAPASKQYLAHFEKQIIQYLKIIEIIYNREIFIVAASDETVTPLLAPILYDLGLSD